ncbi:MAG: type 2 isopentenyl-diphosphate Delta-isomerase [Anaerolineaceae bacterium]|nr:type 2 isopentenyl-diphosphate Delta-isomerase [Anaerolineaceae bacterium]
MQKSEHQIRKDDHIQINLQQDIKSRQTNGFEHFHFQHVALPEFDFCDIDTCQILFGKTLALPFLISSMTGGVEKAEKINRNLAKVAQAHGIAMGVGSQRAMLEDTTLVESFNMRKYAPDILLFANIGAVQLNYGVSIKDLKHLVSSIDADALILHLNSLQEVFQPEGQLNFANLLPKIEDAIAQIDVPVIVKEVGWGISGKLAKQLEDIGVAAVDVAGAGGTSWSQIEKYRSEDVVRISAAEAFRDWGIPTAQCIQDVANKTKTLKVFASGGLSTGVEVAKSIALGADLCGFAGRVLRAAAISENEVHSVINRLAMELKISMFGVGAKSLDELSQAELYNQ